MSGRRNRRRTKWRGVVGNLDGTPELFLPSIIYIPIPVSHDLPGSTPGILDLVLLLCKIKPDTLECS